MTDNQHKSLVLSAIVPSTLCFIAALLQILFIFFGSLTLSKFLVFLSSVLGCIGYFGLLGSYENKLNSEIRKNFKRLICGLIGYFLIFFWTNSTLADLIFIPNDIWDFLFLIISIWILFVYVFYIFLLSKKLKIEKKSN